MVDDWVRKVDLSLRLWNVPIEGDEKLDSKVFMEFIWGENNIFHSL